MKKQPVQSATSLPPSPDAERRSRMIRYLITMAVRLVCFIVAIFMYTWGLTWWSLIPFAGAIILPYVAVVLANTVVEPRVAPVERPGSLVRIGSDQKSADS